MLKTAPLTTVGASPVENEQQAGKMATSILAINTMDRSAKVIQQQLKLGQAKVAAPEFDPHVKMVTDLHNGLVANLTSTFTMYARSPDVDVVRICKRILRADATLFDKGERCMESLRGAPVGSDPTLPSQLQPWLSTDSIGVLLERLLVLLDMTGISTTGVYDQIMEITLGCQEDGMTDVGAIYDTVVRPLLRTLLTTVGNTVTGSMYKLSAPRAEWAVLLSVRKTSDIPTTMSGTMPESQRQAARAMIMHREQAIKIAKEGAQVNLAKLMASIRALEVANSVRQTGTVDKEDKRERDEVESGGGGKRKKGGEVKKKEKRSSFSPFITKSAEVEFYKKYSSKDSAGAKKCMYDCIGQVPGYQSWCLKCPRNSSTHPTKICKCSHAGTTSLWQSAHPGHATAAKNPTLTMIATAIIGVATATGNCLSSGQDMSHCQNMSRIVSDPL